MIRALKTDCKGEVEVVSRCRYLQEKCVSLGGMTPTQHVYIYLRSLQGCKCNQRHEWHASKKKVVKMLSRNTF